MKKQIAKVRRFLMEQISTDKEIAIQCLKIVYAGQTLEEVKKKDSIYRNGRGFTFADSEILTKMVTFYEKRGFLSDKQMEILFRLLPKYWRQVAKVADGDLKIKIVFILNS